MLIVGTWKRFNIIRVIQKKSFMNLMSKKSALSKYIKVKMRC